MNEAEGCPHIKVENWICQECSNKVSSFGCIFDSNKGKVHTYMKVVYENDFLEDFNNANANGNGIASDENGENQAVEQIRQSNDNGNAPEVEDGNGFNQNNANAPEIIYQQYQPSNVTELREYVLFIICKKLKKQYMRTQSILGPGHVNHLSNKLINYLQENDKNRKKLVQKYMNDILLFDSIFECGNLLQAEVVSPTEYQMYMQVDTNTRGHQQWFFFRVKNTKADRKYTFRIMNFTKQGLTTNSTTNNQAQSQQPSGLNQNATIASGAGGQGNHQPNQNQATISGANQQKRSPNVDHLQKIHFKSKQAGDTEWRVIDSDQLEFVKTSVQRKRKDILAAAADSDQEEMNDAEDMIGGDQGNSQKFLNKKSPKKRKPQYYYALQFDVTFTHNNDSVYFAYSLPYTLTEMTELILNKEQQIQFVPPQDEEIKSQNEDAESSKDSEENKQSIPATVQQNPYQMQGAQGGTPSWQENGCTLEIPSKCIFYKREIMARSICGLPLYQITISRDSKTYKRKPVVIITSRVHAAETPASYVFDGIYNFLCSNNSEAKFLRKFYTFILVPTLNPDGVVCGNYRSSISGVDLNRQWIQPDEEFQPEIYSIKQLLKTIGEKERRQLWIYCDLHGHSKKKNSFFYGCNTAANGGFLSWTIVRLLPRIFAKKTHLFNYRDCRFKVEPYKLGTGRVVAWKQFMITHSFTLESSFYGYDFGEDEHRLFRPKEYGEVGSKFCQSIYELHFLWKSIRNELKLTNGWLKPRKLIEITGVPAAQILSEELQKKKKEDLKRKAIEHYEQFLKKFYNKSDVASVSQNNAAANNNRRASKLLSAQNNNPQALFQQVPSSSQKPRVVMVQPGVGVQPKQTGEKSRNRELTSGNTQDRSQHYGGLSGAKGQAAPLSSSQNDMSLQNEEERIYNLLQGLVKIQALIRGFLARKRYKIKIPSIKVGLNKNLSVIRSQTLRDIDDNNIEVQLTNIGGNQLRQSDLNGLERASIHDKLLLGGIAYAEPRPQKQQKEDWRLYFQDNELDTAYNHVEIEREDDPEDALSVGSSSNPSQDNFDLQEIYEQIYQLPNAKEQAKRKKEAKTRFLQEINDQDYIDQQSMFQILDGAFKGKRGQLVHKSINQLKNKIFNKRGKPDQKTNQAASAQVSPEKMIIRRPSLDQKDLNLLKKSNNASPMQQLNHFEDSEAYPLTAHQIIDPNKSSHKRLHTGNQQRHQQYGPNHFQNHQNITNAQIKMFNQNVIIASNNALFGGNGGPHYGKKESIQQVIKDCFITKKIGNASSTQNNFFGSQQSEGSRVHSLNQKSYQNNQYQLVGAASTVTSGTTGQKRQHTTSNHNNKSTGKNHHGPQFKTPGQRLQEQRDQIKQYFNHNQGGGGGGSQLTVGSGYEKYRALMRENAIPMQQQFISYAENNMSYPSPLTMISGKLEINGGHVGPQSANVGQQLVNNSTNSNDQATNSLFMKYVKSKLVRKIKTDQIPQQITDKYIDIYKELIDKEAQKKAEEQDFLRKHQQNPASSIANTFGASSQIISGSTQHMSHQGTQKIPRNSVQTRSEVKSRSKHVSRAAVGAYHNHTSRKQPQQPSSSFITYGMVQQQLPISNKYEDLVGTNVSLNMTFNEQKQQLNEMVRQSSELHRQLQQGIIQNNYNRNQDPTININEKDIKASSNSEILDPSMKLPLIGNFAHTVDYKKKSRESLLENPTSNSGVFPRGGASAQQNMIYAAAINNEEQMISPTKTPLTNSNIQTQMIMLPLGGNYPQQASNQNISMYSINNAAPLNMEVPPVEIQSPQPKSVLQKAQVTGRRHIIGATSTNKKPIQGGGIVSDNSIDSSIDEEMLDKIKNIYSEMRKHAGGGGAASSLYYGGGSTIAQGYPQPNIYYPGINNNTYSRSMMNGPNKGGSYQQPNNRGGPKARINANQSSQMVSNHSVEDNGSGIQSQSHYFNMNNMISGGHHNSKQ